MTTENEAMDGKSMYDDTPKQYDHAADGWRAAVKGRAAELALLNRMIESQAEEIAFLRERVKTLEGTLVEVASHGAYARVHFRPPERQPAEPKTPAARSPRDFARTRPDKPTMTPEEMEQMRSTPIPASVAAVIAATPPQE